MLLYLFNIGKYEFTSNSTAVIYLYYNHSTILDIFTLQEKIYES